MSDESRGFDRQPGEETGDTNANSTGSEPDFGNAAQDAAEQGGTESDAGTSGQETEQDETAKDDAGNER